jgi:ADP-ribose pyrophosphatase YjhB (NUDIX family)
MSLPHLVVAVVCLKGDQVLMVNEFDNGIKCWNQPAGHVEFGESLEQAAVREALEESGYEVTLTGIQGIYQGLHSESNTHYVRIAFTAEAGERVSMDLDDDIIQAKWLNLSDLKAGTYTLRSEITRTTLEDIGIVPISPISLINQNFPGVSS